MIEELRQDKAAYAQVATRIRRARQETLARALKEHPERFVRGVLTVLKVPSAVWINKPKPEEQQDQTAILNKNETLCHSY